MCTLKDYQVLETATLREGLEAIDRCMRGFAIVVDDDGRVAGTLTDGDVRRHLIDGVSLEERLCDCGVYKTDFVSVPDDVIVDDLVDVFRNREISFVPFLDGRGHLAGLVTRGQLYGLLLQCEELPDFETLLDVDEHLMDFEIFQRPWGIYKTTVMQSRYQSKVMQIRPLAQLSLQYHLHREEHWTVVSGEGVAQVGDSLVQVHPGSVIFIPKGCKHRMTNTSLSEQLIIIEAQIGDYFGEDDIIRIEDRYGRAVKPVSGGLRDTTQEQEGVRRVS